MAGWVASSSGSSGGESGQEASPGGQRRGGALGNTAPYRPLQAAGGALCVTARAGRRPPPDEGNLHRGIPSGGEGERLGEYLKA